MTRSATIASSSWSRSTRWARSARTWRRSRPGRASTSRDRPARSPWGRRPAPAYLFVAGGTGISPLRAMLRHLIATDAGVPLSVLYSARVPEELAFRDELERLARRGLIQLHLAVTGPGRRRLGRPPRTDRDRGPGARAAVQRSGVLPVRTAGDGRGRAAAAAPAGRPVEPGADGGMVNRGRRRFLWKGLGSTVALAAGTGLYTLAHRAALGRVRRAGAADRQSAAGAGRPHAGAAQRSARRPAGRRRLRPRRLRSRPRAGPGHRRVHRRLHREPPPDGRARATRLRARAGRAVSRRSASSATTTTVRAGGIRSSPRSWCRCWPTAGFACCATRSSTSAASTSSGSTTCGRSGSSPRSRSPIATRRSRRSSSATIRIRRTSRAGSAIEGWILSGHTHGGQCKPPFLPPPLLPVRNRRYTSGEIDATGGRRLYISRGVGHTMMVRFNARPEVTVFTLQRA